MEENKDKTLSVGKDFRTQLLNRAIGQYKRPDTGKVTSYLEANQIRFNLPNGNHIDVPSIGTIIVGCQKNNPQIVDVDLDCVGGANEGISRQHAIIQVTDEAIYIRDNESKNGVYLNGQELIVRRNYKLRDGDEILFGKIKVQVLFIENKQGHP